MEKVDKCNSKTLFGNCDVNDSYIIKMAKKNKKIEAMSSIVVWRRSLFISFIIILLYSYLIYRNVICKMHKNDNKGFFETFDINLLIGIFICMFFVYFSVRFYDFHFYRHLLTA